MTVRIETFTLGPLETNAYVAQVGQDCCIIDAPLQPQAMIDWLGSAGAAPSALLLTHGHGDHIGGLDELRRAFPAMRVLCPAANAHMLADAQANLSMVFGVEITAAGADELLTPPQPLAVGQIELQVLDTSGHTPGGVSFYWPAARTVFTGDALFAGSIGRTDLPGASFRQLVDNIRANLLPLPDDTRVLAGHMGPTTIGAERAGNPYLA